MANHNNSRCQQCGKCCLANVFSFSTEKDLERWKQEKRDDILHVMEHWQPIWAGDHLISAGSGMYLHGCPFLKYMEDHTACSIYETRPKICRDYEPGSSRICPTWEAGDSE